MWVCATGGRHTKSLERRSIILLREGYALFVLLVIIIVSVLHNEKWVHFTLSILPLLKSSLLHFEIRQFIGDCLILPLISPTLPLCLTCSGQILLFLQHNCMKQSRKQDSLHVCREKTYYKSEKCNRAAVNVLGMGVSVVTLLFVSSCMHVFSIYPLDHWACM